VALPIQPSTPANYRTVTRALRMGVTKDVITPGDGRTFPQTGDQLTMHYQYVGRRTAAHTWTGHNSRVLNLESALSFNGALLSHSLPCASYEYLCAVGHWRRREKSLTRVGIAGVPFRFKLESARSFGYVKKRIESQKRGAAGSCLSSWKGF
jgi:hypothetical protein